MHFKGCETIKPIVVVAVLAIFMCANSMGAVDGAFSKIAEATHVDHTIAVYAGSAPSLTCVISSLLVGSIVGRFVPYKAAAVGFATLTIVAGVAPVFATSFAEVIVSRCFFGLGLGGMMSLQNPVATKLIPLSGRAFVLGLGQSVGFATLCVMQIVGGLLADISWEYSFLTYAILAIPLAFIVFRLPRIPRDAPSKKAKAAPGGAKAGNALGGKAGDGANGTANDAGAGELVSLASEGPAPEAEKSRLPLSAVLMCVEIGIMAVVISPLLFGAAFYVAALSDSATVAAVIAMMFALGSMVGGLLFPKFFARLRNKCFVLFLLLSAGGLAIAAVAPNIPLLGVGFFIGGVGFSMVSAGTMMYLGIACSPDRVGFASALMIICLNIGSFLCSTWEIAVGMVTGDSLYAPLMVGAGVLAALAVIQLVKSPDFGDVQ